MSRLEIIIEWVLWEKEMLKCRWTRKSKIVDDEYYISELKMTITINKLYDYNP